MTAATMIPPGGGRARPSRSTRPFLALALCVPAIYVAYALNNRRHGVNEGKKADQYRGMDKSYLGAGNRDFGGHPPVERSGGGV